MSELDAVEADLKRIWRRLTAALGEYAGDFELELLDLLRRLQHEQLSHEVTGRPVRDLILHYADAASATERVARLLEQTDTLRTPVAAGRPPTDEEMNLEELSVNFEITDAGNMHVIGGGGAMLPHADGQTSSSPPPSPAAYERRERHVLVPVWYATDRKHQPNAGPSERYGRDRAPDNKLLSYGIVKVSIPDHHKPGQVESPKWYRLEFRGDPNKHVLVRSVDEMEEDEWMSSLRDGDTERDLLVFVHGYNTSWADAAKRAAQITFDSRFGGRTVLFTWPSQGTVRGYKTDGEQADWAEPHFLQLLRRLLSGSGARRVHLLAHSMGNRITTSALNHIANEAGKYPTPVREVIFAAPDVDASTFRTFARNFNKLAASFEEDRAPQLTLYTCSVDWALGLSAFYHRWLLRAGDAREQIIIELPMETVEVTDAVFDIADDDPLGHGYFCTNRRVLADLSEVVIHSKRAKSRQLAAASGPDGDYWVMTYP